MKHRGIAVALLVLAIILMAIGGIMDVTGRGHVMGISKQHFWSDGVFALVLSGWILLLAHVDNKG